jgi:hypothetical protein
MAIASNERTTSRWTQLGLLFLVLLPFLPEIAIWIIAGFAKLMGCRPEQPCLGSTTIGEMINWALKFSPGLIVTDAAIPGPWFIVFFAVLGIWLTGCFVMVTLGWKRPASRLAVGFVVTLIFAFLPFLGPGLALLGLAQPKSCNPGTGTCKIYGGEVPEAHAVLRLWNYELQATSIGLTFLLFAIYVVLVIVVSRSRSRAFAGSNEA